jgi:hypothetical protein
VKTPARQGPPPSSISIRRPEEGGLHNSTGIDKTLVEWSIKAWSEAPGAEAPPSNGTYSCSFCGKDQHDVYKLLYVKDTFICDECVSECTRLLHKDEEDGRMAEKASDEWLRISDNIRRNEDISEQDAAMYLLLGYASATVATARQLEEDAVRKAKGKSSEEGPPSMSSTTSVLCCSFCGKSKHEVYKIITGPGASICDICVKECRKLICKSPLII